MLYINLYTCGWAERAHTQSQCEPGGRFHFRRSKAMTTFYRKNSVYFHLFQQDFSSLNCFVSAYLYSKKLYVKAEGEIISKFLSTEKRILDNRNGILTTNFCTKSAYFVSTGTQHWLVNSIVHNLRNFKHLNFFASFLTKNAITFNFENLHKKSFFSVWEARRQSFMKIELKVFFSYVRHKVRSRQKTIRKLDVKH